MKIEKCIEELIQESSNLFETDNGENIKSILVAKNIVFLDTCFITKSFFFDRNTLFDSFVRMFGGKDVKNVVFVVTELVLYELKDSSNNELQAKNLSFFSDLKQEGFRVVILNEETVYNHLKPYLGYSNKRWNELFTRWVHDNVAVFRFANRIRTDNRTPYYGFSEINYNTPSDSEFVSSIIRYIKNTKKDKDSLAEELVCITLFFFLEIISESNRQKVIFCTHDFRAIDVTRKAIYTSFPTSCCFKIMHVFGLFQYMVKEGLITSRKEATQLLRKIMGDSVSLMVRERSPFVSEVKRVDIQGAVDLIFSEKDIELICEK